MKDSKTCNPDERSGLDETRAPGVAAARDDEERYRRIALLQPVLDTLPDPVVVVDATGTIIVVNAAWRSFVGASGYAGADDGLGANYLEMCGTAADAEQDQMGSHEQVSPTKVRLYEFSRQLVEAQELKQRQITRDFHDQIGQNLAMLNIAIEIARSQLSRESVARIGERLTDAQNLVDETIERIRDVLAELRPAVLDDYGLTAALRWYVPHVAKRIGIAARFHIDELEPRLPAALETALFRITQEALTNVARHAHAKLVRVSLTVRKRTIRLVIADDGAGFDPKALRKPNQRGSLGLTGMRERAEAYGGRLLITSAPGQGTRVVVEVARRVDDN